MRRSEPPPGWSVKLICPCGAWELYHGHVLFSTWIARQWAIDEAWAQHRKESK